MWSKEQFLNAFRNAAVQIAETVERKNADYTGGADPFANFKLIETVTNGRISAEDGLLIRKTDKLGRMATLLNGGKAAVSDESFIDTCLDDAAYSIILALLRRSQSEPDELPAADPIDATIQEAEARGRAIQEASNAGAMERLRDFIRSMQGGGAIAAA